MFLAHGAVGAQRRRVALGDRRGCTPCRRRCPRPAPACGSRARPTARGDEVEHLLDLVARQVHRGDRVLEREHVVHLLDGERARLEVGADAERVGEREVGLDALAQAASTARPGCRAASRRRRDRCAAILGQLPGVVGHGTTAKTCVEVERRWFILQLSTATAGWRCPDRSGMRVVDGDDACRCTP